MGVVSSALAALAVTLAVAAFGLGGAWVEVGLLLALGVAWLIGLRRGQDWAGSLGIAGIALAAGWGVRMQLDAAWLLCGVVAALGSWDLDRFERLLARASSVTNGPLLWRGHLVRLAPVLAAGLLLGLVALNLQVTLSFAWLIGLGALALFGLSRAIALLRRESD